MLKRAFWREVRVVARVTSLSTIIEVVSEGHFDSHHSFEPSPYIYEMKIIITGLLRCSRFERFEDDVSFATNTSDGKVGAGA